MFVDEAGALWLSDPWFVVLTLIASVAIVGWCHQWLENGAPPRPRVTMLRNQTRVMRTRALRTHGAPSHSTVVALDRFTKDPHSIARARGAAGLRRSA
jgi:hypothetical protein